MSSSIETLIAARALQGAGAALVMPMTLAIVSVAYPAEMRGRALGIFGSIVGLAPLSGPAIGGVISQQLHWTWIFWINIPIVMVLIACAALKLRESYGPPRRVDVVGIGLIAGLSFATAWALMRGNDAGWASMEVTGSLVFAAALLVALVIWLKQSSNPVVPPHLFRAQGFGGGLLTAFFLYGGLYSTLFFITQFLQVAQGYGPMEAGLRLLPWTATLFVVAPISGSLINRTGERPLAVAGLLVNAVGLALLAINVRTQMSLATMAPALVLMGVGVSMAMPSLQSGILRNIGPADIGKASGAFSMSQFLGGMFGIAVMACVFSVFGSYQSPDAFAEGFRAVAIATAIMVTLGAISGLSLAGGSRRAPEQIVAAG